MNRKALRWQAAAPASEPVSLAAAKKHLRVAAADTSEDADVIQPSISAAREYCENITGAALASETITAAYCDVASGDALTLPRQPIASITSIIADGRELEADEDYKVSTLQGMIKLLTKDPYEEIVVTYQTGSVTLPFTVRQAMLLLIAHWYDNREAVIIGSVTSVKLAKAVDDLLNQNKEWWF